MELPRVLDPGDLLDRLSASDPTRERLRTGLRAVLGAALSAALLSRAATRWGLPPTIWLLGVSLAMSAALFVPEAGPAAERRGFAVVTAAGASAAALAALAGGAPHVAAQGIALAVVFAAVWSRRSEAAGAGAGMAAFLTFFVGIYFGLRPREAPAAAAAVVAGGAVGCAVRFAAIRTRPELDAPRSLRALRLTVATVLRRLEDAVLAPASRREARRLAADIDRLHEAALAVDDRIVRLPGPETSAGVTLGELRDRVFELQLAAERVVQAVGQVVSSDALPAPARRLARAALDAARREARGRRGAAAGVVPLLTEAGRRVRELRAPPRAHDDVRRLGTSLVDLARAARWVREAAPSRLPPPVAAPPPPPGGRGPLGLTHPTRQAIQATLAAAIAMTAGARLSSTRWFWAVIAAFVMFTGATTVADTVERAWLRVVGTVLGAGAGLLAGAVVAGHRRLELGAAFACVFLAYWLFRVSYAWLLFWFTALIAVLYRLLGRFTPELMVLRVEETVVGAGIGVVVAAVVLPVRARTRVRAATAEVLRAAAGWIDLAVIARATGGASDAPLDAARAMEDRLRALRATARPLAGGTIRSPRAAHLVHAATALVLHARHLAPGEALARLDATGRADVAEAGRRLARSARRTAAIFAGEAVDGPAADRGPAADPIGRVVASLRGQAAIRHGPTSPPVWLHWLERIDEALRDLAAVAGGPGRPPAPPAAGALARARS